MTLRTRRTSKSRFALNCWLRDQLPKLQRISDHEFRARLDVDPWSIVDRRERYEPFAVLLRSVAVRTWFGWGDFWRAKEERDRERESYCHLLEVFKEDYHQVTCSWADWFKSRDVWFGGSYRKMVIHKVTFMGVYGVLRAAFVLHGVYVPGAGSLAALGARYVEQCFPRLELIVSAVGDDR